MSWDREKERRAGRNMTIGSAVFGLVFAIVWCVLAGSMAPFMLLFGIPFAGMMAYRLYVLLRMSREQEKSKPSDPWEQPAQTPRQAPADGGYCPYCGAAVEESFAYCPKCGRKLK